MATKRNCVFYADILCRTSPKEFFGRHRLVDCENLLVPISKEKLSEQQLQAFKLDKFHIIIDHHNREANCTLCSSAQIENCISLPFVTNPDQKQYWLFEKTHNAIISQIREFLSLGEQTHTFGYIGCCELFGQQKFILQICCLNSASSVVIPFKGNNICEEELEVDKICSVHPTDKVEWAKRLGEGTRKKMKDYIGFSF